MRGIRIYLVFVIGVVLSPAFENLLPATEKLETGHTARWEAPTVEQVLPGVWRLRFGTPERFTPTAVRETQPCEQGFATLPAPNLLAAPLLGQAASRNVRLPGGTSWCELKTGAWHPGGTTVTVTGVPGDMPLFVRENSLLPLAEPVQQVGADTVFEITVKAFGANPAPYTLFEDDGTSFDFESGKANRVVLSWTATDGGRVTRSGAFAGRRYDIRHWESVPGPTDANPAPAPGSK